MEEQVMIYVYHIIIGLLFSALTALLSYMFGYNKGFLHGYEKALGKEGELTKTVSEKH